MEHLSLLHIYDKNATWYVRNSILTHWYLTKSNQIIFTDIPVTQIFITAPTQSNANVYQMVDESTNHFVANIVMLLGMRKKISEFPKCATTWMNFKSVMLSEERKIE